MIGQCCHLGEMGNGNNLMVCTELTHLHANGSGNLTAYIGINFVKDEQGGVIPTGKSTLQRQHDSRQLTAGGDESQSFERLAGVRAEQEICLFGTVGARLGQGLKADFEK